MRVPEPRYESLSWLGWDGVQNPLRSFILRKRCQIFSRAQQMAHFLSNCLCLDRCRSQRLKCSHCQRTNARSLAKMAKTIFHLRVIITDRQPRLNWKHFQLKHKTPSAVSLPTLQCPTSGLVTPCRNPSDGGLQSRACVLLRMRSIWRKE